MADMQSDRTKLISDGIMIFMILTVKCDVILPSDFWPSRVGLRPEVGAEAKPVL